MTIWKFELAITAEQPVSMPKGARILSAGEQRGTLCLWALVDETQPTEERIIWIVGTGNPAKHVMVANHLGTVQMGLVWHVFERRPCAADQVDEAGHLRRP